MPVIDDSALLAKISWAYFASDTGVLLGETLLNIWGSMHLLRTLRKILVERGEVHGPRVDCALRGMDELKRRRQPSEKACTSLSCAREQHCLEPRREGIHDREVA